MPTVFTFHDRCVLLTCEKISIRHQGFCLSFNYMLESKRLIKLVILTDLLRISETFDLSGKTVQDVVTTHVIASCFIQLCLCTSRANAHTVIKRRMVSCCLESCFDSWILEFRTHFGNWCLWWSNSMGLTVVCKRHRPAGWKASSSLLLLLLFRWLQEATIS